MSAYTHCAWVDHCNSSSPVSPGCVLCNRVGSSGGSLDRSRGGRLREERTSLLNAGSDVEAVDTEAANIKQHIYSNSNNTLLFMYFFSLTISKTWRLEHKS